MGRHVNHQDEQDKLILRNSKIIRSSRYNRSGSIEDKDPATLTIKEQEKILKQKLILKQQIKDNQKPIQPEIRISHYK